MGKGDAKQSHAIETASRMRVWWLSTFNGYVVSAVTRRPRPGVFGRIIYDTTWRLRASGKR